MKLVTPKLIVLIFLGMTLTACQDLKSPEKPEKLIPEDKMSKILTDLVLMDASMSVNFSKFKKTKLEPNQFIYDKYQVDSLTLLENIRYYNSDFENNQKIYERVKENLELKRTRFDSIKSAQDSLSQKDVDLRQPESD
ncbi:MAG: DUF4296 domain-containing protein [Bacteroidota bacterium]